MAKTAAQRQAAYRAKRAFAGNDGNGERRLNVWLSTESALALERLAKRYAVTKREMLEKLIRQADGEIVKSLILDSPQWDDYFGVTQ